MSAELSHSADLKEHSGSTGMSRWSSALLLTAIGLPMIMAYVVFYTGWGIPTNTVNKGQLISPATSLTDLVVTDTASKSVDLFSEEKKWRWIIVGNNECDVSCENTLYLSRQVHIRLGEKARRLERVYLNTANAYSSELSASLSQHHPRLKQLHVSEVSWHQIMSETNVAKNVLNGSWLYMVDQEGFAMMTYDQSHQGADMLDDIKRLLKYSYDE